MSSKKRFIVVCLILFLIPMVKTLAQNTVYFPQAYFNKSDATDKLKKGRSTIKGLAFTRERNQKTSSVKHYANNKIVMLFPVTSYFEEWNKLYKAKGSLPNVNVVMDEEAFKYRLETLTDEYGNFSFTEMKPGLYYLQCDIDFVGTDMSYRDAGRTNYYNGYGYYVGSTPLYQAYFYNYNASHRQSKIIEINTNGQLIEVKLKPQIFETPAIAKLFMSTVNCYQKNNLQYGSCSEFYENGKLKNVGDWEKGMLDGKARYFYQNGFLQAEGEYKKSFKVGTWKYYSETHDGLLHTEEVYVFVNKMSVKEGLFKYYYPSGKIKSTNIYDNDLLQGTSYEYFESGGIKSKYDFKNSKYDGKTYFYDEKGNLIETVTYKEGKEISSKK